MSKQEDAMVVGILGSSLTELNGVLLGSSVINDGIVLDRRIIK